jgi:hypothetical protein
MTASIRTIELAAWELDAYEFRPPSLALCHASASPKPYVAAAIFCEDETHLLRERLDRQRTRPDLQAEMRGLDWTLGVVDLRHLLAFQRRLSFRDRPARTIPSPTDWAALIDLAFAALRPPVFEAAHDPASNTLLLQSHDPNFHVRIDPESATPLSVSTGGPFFEVATYRNRWFLRDGYHRAYDLMQAGIFAMPAVIVHARTLAELGADAPWFFPESVLFSSHPPRLADFLDPALTIQYHRPSTLKTIRLTIEESLTAAPAGEPT